MEWKTKNTTLETVAKSYNKIGKKGKSDSVNSQIHNFLAWYTHFNQKVAKLN
jgi:hypothetical protein